MKNFYEKMDSLPIVKLLQISAFIIFIFGLPQFISLLLFPFFQSSSGGFEYSYRGFQFLLSTSISLATTLIKIIFEPMVLLALAEIIKRK
jgi:hypothetical protein